MAFELDDFGHQFAGILACFFWQNWCHWAVWRKLPVMKIFHLLFFSSAHGGKGPLCLSASTKAFVLGLICTFWTKERSSSSCPHGVAVTTVRRICFSMYEIFWCEWVFFFRDCFSSPLHEPPPYRGGGVCVPSWSEEPWCLGQFTPGGVSHDNLVLGEGPD